MIALDTNILVYAASRHELSGRHQAALNLLGKLGVTGAIVPLPVIGELFNARRKKKFCALEILLNKVEIWVDAFDWAAPQVEDYLNAAEISNRYDLQYFDTLIIAVARRAGASILLSEDMQNGLEVDGLRIINPFVAANDAILVEALAG